MSETFSILHITDAHFGQDGMPGRWPVIKAQFLQDVRHMIQHTGKLDLVVFTGDIANRALSSEYQKASEFLYELGIAVYEESENFPPLATVPGNHDVSRPPESSVMKRVLERYWDVETEKDMFSLSGDSEILEYSKSMFANYTEWTQQNDHGLPTLSNFYPGVLPGDFTGSEASGSFSVGVAGLNSSFRHVSDFASEGGLTLSASQIHAAASGDFPKWSQQHDATIVLSHHPMSWISAPEESEDALFNPVSTARLHLCGHLHEEKFTSKGTGTSSNRLQYQGQSLFGLEKFQGKTEQLDRQHGYAIVTLEKSETGISSYIWPREARRQNDGTWTIDRHSTFGLDRGQIRSKTSHLLDAKGIQITSVTTIAPTPSRSTSSEKSKINLEDNNKKFLSDLKQGQMVVVIGDRIVANATAEKQQLAIQGFRIDLWNTLGISSIDDPLYGTDQLLRLVQEREPKIAGDVVKRNLRVTATETGRQIGQIVNGPWAGVVYLSPLCDLENFVDLQGSNEGFRVIDGTSAAYRVPDSVSSFVLRLASSSDSVNGSEVLFESELSMTPKNSFSDWRSYAKQLVSRSPTLFITDSVNSLSFWNWISDRDGGDANFLMPAYLVCPSLPDHYVSLLARYNVLWIESTVKDFANKYLVSSRQEYAEGRASISRRRGRGNNEDSISITTKINNGEVGSREYLLGRIPNWGDIIQGYSVRLSEQKRVIDRLRNNEGLGNVVLLTGTAGAGKTTILMQCALDLRAQHKNVAWIGVDNSLPIGEIIERVLDGDYDYVFVDDVDRFGDAAVRLLQQLNVGRVKKRTIVAGVRSVRENVVIGASFTDRLVLGNPTDQDFRSLVECMRKNRAVANNRLSDNDLLTLLKDTSEGQLIVGMIQATSGVPFGKKIAEECGQLSDTTMVLYGCAAIVTMEREGISASQMQDAVGGDANVSWRGINDLVRFGLLFKQTGSSLYIVRHSVVAQEVRSFLKKTGALAAIVKGTLRAFAASAAELREYSDPARRTLIRLLSHSYLISLGLSAPQIRGIYDAVEDILANDFHYWLQRGAFEVEMKEYVNAMHDLTAARTIPDGERHHNVLTEYGYLRLKLARRDRGAESTALALEALEDLFFVLKTHGPSSPHTYSILAREGVPWLRDAPLTESKRLELATEAQRLLQMARPLAAINDEIAACLPGALAILAKLLENG